MDFLKKEPTQCPLCLQPCEVLETWADNRILACKECLFAFQEVLPSQEALHTYYESVYRVSDDRYVHTPEEYHRRKEQYLKQRWFYLKDYYGPGQTILDVGCATGRWMELMAEQGVTVNGIEPYLPYAEYARRFGPVRHGCIEETILPQQYDGICMFHLLEHLRDPLSALVQLRKHLVEGGRLFLEVPHLNDAMMFCYVWPDDIKHFTKPHLWTFTEKSLDMVLKEAGWIVSRVIHYQREGLIKHLARAIDPQPGPITKRIGIRKPLLPFMMKLDAMYRTFLEEKKISDILLIVAVNIGTNEHVGKHEEES